MHLEFTYTPLDFQEMMLAAASESGDPNQKAAAAVLTRSRLGLLGWMLFLGLAVVFFLILQQRPTPAPSRAPSPGPFPGPTLSLADQMLKWLLPIVPWVLVFGFIWIFVYRQLRAARHVFEVNPGAGQPKTIDLSDAGIRVSDPLSTTDWRWEGFIALVETTNLFLLKRSDGSYLMIPKRAASPGQLDVLRLELGARMPAPGAFPVLPPKQS